MKKAYPQKAGGHENQVLIRGEKESVRINKYLTAAGFCSRRQADRLVEEQRVKIDGAVAEIGAQVRSGQFVTVDGKAVIPAQNHVYIALNKPVGITCTLEEDIIGNIGDFMDFHRRIFPIGRLDKDSSGLILLTSDGDIVNDILRAENNNEKEYIVKVNRAVTEEFLNKMRGGVEITNMRTKKRVVTKESRVEQIGAKSFKIVLTQGFNRQIRRMCTELGYRVAELRRVRIMNIGIGDLAIGQWRYLTQEELDGLGGLL